MAESHHHGQNRKHDNSHNGHHSRPHDSHHGRHRKHHDSHKSHHHQGSSEHGHSKPHDAQNERKHRPGFQDLAVNTKQQPESFGHHTRFRAKSRTNSKSEAQRQTRNESLSSSKAGATERARSRTTPSLPNSIKNAIEGDKQVVVQKWLNGLKKLEIFESITPQGENVFHLAARTGHTKIFRMLIEGFNQKYTSSIGQDEGSEGGLLGDETRPAQTRSSKSKWGRPPRHPKVLGKLTPPIGKMTPTMLRSGHSTVTDEDGLTLKSLVDQTCLPDRHNCVLLAAKHGHTKITMELINVIKISKASLNAKDKQGSTALDWAILGGHEMMAMELISAGSLVMDAHLETAVEKGYPEVFKACMESSENVKKVERYETRSEQTLLDRALSLGQEEVANTIARNFCSKPLNVGRAEGGGGGGEADRVVTVSGGLVVSEVNCFQAASLGCVAVLEAWRAQGLWRLLEDPPLRHPFDLVQPAGKFTLVHWATQARQTRVAQFLLKEGARADLRDSLELYPVDWALLYGYADMVMVLIHAKKRSPLNDIATLRLAVKHNMVPFVQAFLESREFLDLPRAARSAMLDTLVDLGARSGASSVLRLLVDLGLMTLQDTDQDAIKRRSMLFTHGELELLPYLLFHSGPPGRSHICTIKDCHTVGSWYLKEATDQFRCGRHKVVGMVSRSAFSTVELMRKFARAVARNLPGAKVGNEESEGAAAERLTQGVCLLRPYHFLHHQRVPTHNEAAQNGFLVRANLLAEAHPRVLYVSFTPTPGRPYRPEAPDPTGYLFGRVKTFLEHARGGGPVDYLWLRPTSTPVPFGEAPPSPISTLALVLATDILIVPPETQEEPPEGGTELRNYHASYSDVVRHSVGGPWARAEPVLGAATGARVHCAFHAARGGKTLLDEAVQVPLGRELYRRMGTTAAEAVRGPQAHYHQMWVRPDLVVELESVMHLVTEALWGYGTQRMDELLGLRLDPAEGGPLARWRAPAAARALRAFLAEGGEEGGGGGGGGGGEAAAAIPPLGGPGTSPAAEAREAFANLLAGFVFLYSHFGGDGVAEAGSRALRDAQPNLARDRAERRRSLTQDGGGKKKSSPRGRSRSRSSLRANGSKAAAPQRSSLWELLRKGRGTAAGDHDHRTLDLSLKAAKEQLNSRSSKIKKEGAKKSGSLFAPRNADQSGKSLVIRRVSSTASLLDGSAAEAMLDDSKRSISIPDPEEDLTSRPARRISNSQEMKKLAAQNGSHSNSGIFKDSEDDEPLPDLKLQQGLLELMKMSTSQPVGPAISGKQSPFKDRAKAQLEEKHQGSLDESSKGEQTQQPTLMDRLFRRTGRPSPQGSPEFGRPKIFCTNPFV